MKKIFYLFAAITMAFTACQKQPNLVPSSYVRGGSNPINLTLQQSDYKLLPTSDYPHYTYTFDNSADANKYIPVILNTRDPQIGNGSIANVTYAVSAPYFKVADSVYADVAYKLTSSDYLLLPGNKYPDFGLSQVLEWLPYKYPNPVNNQLALLTFAYYNAGSTTTTTMSFLYIGGSWQVIYTISPAQYQALGLGKYNQFTSSQNGNLPGYFNALMKQDVNLMATAKLGDIQYVSFGYYGGGSFQRVLPLEYDGTNWVINANLTNTLAFLKSDGSWIPNPTVYYTLNSQDISLIAASSINTDAERATLAKYGDFDSSWTTAYLQSAIILVLTADFPNPKVNIDYKITYLAYNGATVPTVLTFQYDGTQWVAK